MKDPMKMLRQVQQMQDRMAKAAEGARDGDRRGDRGRRRGARGGDRHAEGGLGARSIPGATEDLEMLQDLVVAAVNEALEKSKQLAAAKMQARRRPASACRPDSCSKQDATCRSCRSHWNG